MRVMGGSAVDLLILNEHNKLFRAHHYIVRILCSMEQVRAFSAPGKALLVGGYLVLNPKYKSYVVALSARMHAVVSKCKSKNGGTRVTVTSIQFNNDRWSYDVVEQNGYSVNSIDGKRNPFIEMVIFNVISYYRPSLTEGLEIKIDVFSDSGYHSQAGSTIKRNVFKEFSYHPSSISEVPKTGLGSSAGLATVVTAALSSVFKQNLSVNNDQDLAIIHNLAQVAHCQAQGKVGSGFDVAAATFGSIIYQRFSPEIITSLPEHSAGFVYQDELKRLVDDVDWMITRDRVRLPDQLRLVMGDVNSGSETTKLVAKVNAWYNSNLPRSFEIYEDMNAHNLEFINALTELNHLSTSDPHTYQKIIDAIGKGEFSQIEQVTELAEVTHSVRHIRQAFRLITKESGADIEPPVQTELLDACMQLKGVLTAMIPGAGGYDAISLITTDKVTPATQTEGDERFKNVTWLDMSQADIGVIEENPEHYQNLQ